MTFRTTGGTFTLAPGASRTVTITAAATKGAADGHKQATLGVTSGGTEVAHAMLYALVGARQRAPGRHMLRRRSPDPRPFDNPRKVRRGDLVLRQSSVRLQRPEGIGRAPAGRPALYTAGEA